MPDPTLYLFDGYNVFHAGSFSDVRELKNALSSFVALRGARGVVVFDGVGEDEILGRLEVRYAQPADALLERLAVENRNRERVCLVSSDATVLGTSGQEVAKLGSRSFVAQLDVRSRRQTIRSQIADRLSPDVRTHLERWRRERR
jgi:predicted RNA-binding protein with PIN domain